MSGFLALHNLSVGQFEYLWWTGHKLREWPTNQNKGLVNGPMRSVVYRAHGAYVSYIHLFIKSIFVNCKKLVVKARVINDQGDTPSQWGGQSEAKWGQMANQRLNGVRWPIRGLLGSDDQSEAHWGQMTTICVTGVTEQCPGHPMTHDTCHVLADTHIHQMWGLRHSAHVVSTSQYYYQSSGLCSPHIL